MRIFTLRWYRGRPEFIDCEAGDVVVISSGRRCVNLMDPPACFPYALELAVPAALICDRHGPLFSHRRFAVAFAARLLRNRVATMASKSSVASWCRRSSPSVVPAEAWN